MKLLSYLQVLVNKETHIKFPIATPKLNLIKLVVYVDQKFFNYLFFLSI